MSFCGSHVVFFILVYFLQLFLGIYGNTCGFSPVMDLSFNYDSVAKWSACSVTEYPEVCAGSGQGPPVSFLAWGEYPG